MSTTTTVKKTTLPVFCCRKDFESAFQTFLQQATPPPTKTELLAVLVSIYWVNFDNKQDFDDDLKRLEKRVAKGITKEQHEKAKKMMVGYSALNSWRICRQTFGKAFSCKISVYASDFLAFPSEPILELSGNILKIEVALYVQVKLDEANRLKNAKGQYVNTLFIGSNLLRPSFVFWDPPLFLGDKRVYLEYRPF